MSKVAILNIGMHGHVNPTLGFSQQLVEKGHKVSFLSTQEFANSITATGAHFISYPSILGQAIALTAKSQAEYVAAGMTPPKSMSVMQRFIEEFAATFSTLFRFFSEEKPDLVVYDFVSMAGWIIARHFQIKSIRFYTTYASNAHFDLMRETFAKNERPSPEEFLKAQSLIDQICHQHGCESIQLSDFMGHVESDNLVFMPRSFQPLGHTFDERYHFVGPCVRSIYHNEVLSLVPNGTGPILLISLGSLFHEWQEFYHFCLKAFGNTRWRVVMAIGRLDASELGAIPPNFSVMAHIPQIELLAYANLFISHGGMNSTMEAGAFGVPLVVIPQIEEQEVTAQRVQESELGVYLKRSEVSSESLALAVDSVFKSKKIYANMTRLKEEIALSGGTKKVCDLIESRLNASNFGQFSGPSQFAEA